MQVGILPAAPLPGGVKVARRFVKPHGVGASPTLAANLGCNVSIRRPCSERGGSRCNSCHPDHFWKAGSYKLAAPVLKTGSARAEVGALPTPSASYSPLTKGKSMKPVIRYHSQLLFRKSYKPNRLIRIRPAAKPSVTFRPARRFGVKPQLELVS